MKEMSLKWLEIVLLVRYSLLTLTKHTCLPDTLWNTAITVLFCKIQKILVAKGKVMEVITARHTLKKCVLYSHFWWYNWYTKWYTIIICITLLSHRQAVFLPTTNNMNTKAFCNNTFARCIEYSVL